MTVDEIVVTDADGIVTVTLDRPAMKNAISVAMFEALRDTFRAITAQQQARCVVLTGTRDFAAGADLSRAGDDAPRARVNTLYSMRVIHDAVIALTEIPVPVVAKVRGVAVGAGMSLALACDLVVASTDARFAAIFARRGLSLDCGASWLLPRLVGIQKAKEIALLAEMIGADEAKAIGLVNRVVTDDELDGAVDELARRLSRGPTVALSMTKRLLNNAFTSSLVESLEAEAMAQAVNGVTDDTREGMLAFLEKRDATFKGR
jgi:2-(1,2-epoxy-1,2-dihydrophenyl)acetyl-CoA isomerase